jgi:hypothetical protein
MAGGADICHTPSCDNFGFDNSLSNRVLAVGHGLELLISKKAAKRKGADIRQGRLPADPKQNAATASV